MSFELEGLMRWKDPEGPADYASFRQAQQAKAVENYDAPAVSHLPTDEQELHQFATEDMTWTNYPDMIAENNRKIAELEQELSQLEQQYGNADEMDRRLAANRARIGDLSNSQAHQQRIENRKTMAASSAKDLEGQRDDLINKIRNIDLSLSYATDSKVQNELKTQRLYLMDKLTKMGGSYGDSSSAMPGNGASSDDLERFITMNTDAGLWKSPELRQQAQVKLTELMKLYGETIDPAKLQGLKDRVDAETPDEKQAREQREAGEQQKKGDRDARHQAALNRSIEKSNQTAEDRGQHTKLVASDPKGKKAAEDTKNKKLKDIIDQLKKSYPNLKQDEYERAAKKYPEYQEVEKAINSGKFTDLNGKTWTRVKSNVDNNMYWGD